MPQLRRFIANRFHSLAQFSLIALFIGTLGLWQWIAELFSHFVLYYAVLFLLASLFNIGSRRIAWFMCAILLAILLVLPLKLHQPAGAAQSTLLWYNVHLENPELDLEIRRIQQLNPDYIALAEANLNQAAWRTLQQTHPNGCQHTEDSPFSLVLWSRQPLVQCQVMFVDDIPYIHAQLSDQSSIFVLHPPPPINGELAATRQKYLEMVAEQIGRTPNALVVGDFNSSPFSPLFFQFTQRSGVSSNTPNWLPTWKPFFINIDHVLSKNQTICVAPQAWQYSDHRALLVTRY